MRVSVDDPRRRGDRRLQRLRPSGARPDQRDLRRHALGRPATRSCRSAARRSHATQARMAAYGRSRRPGTVVNVRFPGPSVGGNTETQPKLVGMLLGAFAPALPDLRDGGGGRDVVQLPLRRRSIPRRGIRMPTTTSRRAAGAAVSTTDGNSAQNHIHGNCRNTPVEVFETRFPFLTHAYALIPDSGGPGRRRGGLAVRRMLEVLAPRGHRQRADGSRRSRRLGPLRRQERPLRRDPRLPSRRATDSATSARPSAP